MDVFFTFLLFSGDSQGVYFVVYYEAMANRSADVLP